MARRHVKSLLGKLNSFTTQALEGAAGLCVQRTHYEVTLLHVLSKLLGGAAGGGGSDVSAVLRYFEGEEERLRKALTHALEDLRSGNTGRPTFSPRLLETVEAAWVVASVRFGTSEVRSGHLLLALLEKDPVPLHESVREALAPVRPEAFEEHFTQATAGSSEEAAAQTGSAAGSTGAPDGSEAPGGEGTALARFTTNLTARAEAGEIDPIFGRRREIRQIIDILGRRRKNNAILVGEAGVGKTALAEGLARRIAHGAVPRRLEETNIHALDLGLLQAGASMRGEFEERLKSVLAEVRTSARPVLLFVDEAHALIGAGGQSGTGDAANLLKPALTRGEIRVVAATTWSEYKKHIEKDPALERRFQMVHVEEPTAEEAAVMLRGLKGLYEEHHGVRITDEAVWAIANFADRYVSGRQLPDKAVDLLDTACTRVKSSQSATPSALDDLEQRLLELEIEEQALRRDLRTGLRHDEVTLEALAEQRRYAEEERKALEERWSTERDLTKKLQQAREEIAGEMRSNGRTSRGEQENQEEHGIARERVQALQADLEAAQRAGSGKALVHPQVDEDVVAQVTSDWTGIPIGNMLRDEAETLLTLEDRLEGPIRGQREALVEIADALRAAKAGLGEPEAPLGVFLLVGPSGVGKTETARQLAELLFGGERFLTTINMSEYQESHTTSQLKGSPPGYVGYGEGGVLTEAVRQRPYSVVLLDEVEKAHPDAMELFYQVFDKGTMRDGEGRDIDFRNTVIMMTSNVGSDLLLRVAGEDDTASESEGADESEDAAPSERPDPGTLRDQLHPHLLRHFPAALLGRMRVVPYYPLGRRVIEDITRLKLDRLAERLERVHETTLHYTPAAVHRIADRCTQSDMGARNIDAVIDRDVLPNASRRLLARLSDAPVGNDGRVAEDGALPRLTLDLTRDGQGFSFSFDDEFLDDDASSRIGKPVDGNAPLQGTEGGDGSTAAVDTAGAEGIARE